MQHLFRLTASIALCLPVLPVRAQFVISEFMANNLTGSIVDEDSQHEDWIEIQNNGPAPATLNGWYLTDNAGQLRKWQFPLTTPVITVAAGARITVWASDKNRKASAARLHANFKLSSEGEFLALVRPDGVTIADSYAPAYPPQFPNGSYGRVPIIQTTVMVPETGPGRVRSPLSADDFTTNFTGWNSAPGFNDSGWQAGAGPYGFGSPFTAEIGPAGDLSAMMKGLNPLCLFRFAFNYTPGNPVAAVRLRTKFDDGFSAWLNGTPSTGLGQPPSVLAWNTPAPSQRDDVLAPSPIASTPPNWPGALIPGANVLAMAVYNSAATELTGTPPTDTTNVLFSAQLEVDTITGYNTGYLTSPTRGTPNNSLRTSVGPAIRNTTNRPDQPTGGAGSAPLLISTTVTPTLRPLAVATPVQLRWRRLYAAESSVPMLDDGTGGDVQAGDGIYSALLPVTSLLPGDMIRWRVQAMDNATPPVHSYDPPYPGFSSTSPPTPTPVPTTGIDAEQYFGTMALPVLTGTPGVPVLHWFLNGPDNSINATGTRSSFFWKPLPLENPPPGYLPPAPRFYDNVNVDLHGQTSAGFPKKSHDLSFSKDNRFLWKDGTPESSGLNLLTNYADKSKVRNAAAWWVWEKSGHLASHYSTIVRVQQNNAFKGLYDMVENAYSAWLERSGLDANGTLYKMYNALNSPSPPGAEKKNPDDIDSADLAAFINGLDPAQTRTARLAFLYDNTNVPGLINFLAVHALILSRDFGHKNYYLFRDTNGTRDWTMLPWDEDLCMGHTYNAGQGYFDDDIHSQGPFQLGNINRLMEMVFSTPELNHLFVRRLRTLADQFLVSPTEMNGPIARFINDQIQRIDPVPDNTNTGTDDADLEARAWGFWVDGSSALIPYTDPRLPAHTARAQALRITTANPNPPQPGETAYIDGTTTLLPFLPGRRDFFFRNPPPSSPGYGGVTLANQTLPGSQPVTPSVIIEQITPAPRTGLYQNQEFLVLRNPNNYAVDLSGWKLGGDIEMTFQGGTVIPAAGLATTQAANASYVNQLIVANQPAGIRTRTTSPMANQFRLVTGPYNRQLNGRGGVITLNRPNDPMDPGAGYTQVQSVSYPAAPTPHQDFLRITELNHRPAPPTQAELAVVPGLVAGDFEFIELMNTGTAPLDLGKSFFDEGVEFTFPTTFVLAPGERCVVVASQTAFTIRYGSSIRVAGEFTGALSNDGERLRLMDSFGEMVLDFRWDNTWLPLPPGQYRSLAINQPLPAWSAYGLPSSWQLSLAAAGTPGTGEAGFSLTFESWYYQKSAGTPAAGMPDPAADPDGDGWTNFQEYAFGSQPFDPSSTVAVTAGLVETGGQRYQTITFTRPQGSIDLNYVVETTVNPTLTAWENQAVPEGSPVPVAGGMEEVTWRDTVPLGTPTRRFLRAAARR